MSYFSKFNRKGIPFMEGGEKKELKDVFGQEVHITDFGFIDGKDGKFAVIQLKETPNVFYFGNAIITEMLLEVEKDDKKAELPEAAIIFSQKTSKETGRDYTAFEFVE